VLKSLSNELTTWSQSLRVVECSKCARDISGKARIVASTDGATTQARHDTRAELAQIVLNGSCLRPARHTRLIWSSIPPHDNDGPHLSCRTSFVPASFLSLLMPPPPRHPIIGRGRGSKRILPIFVQHQPRHGLAQWLLHVHEYVSRYACTIIFVVVGRLVRLPGLRPVLPPNLLPPPTVVAASRPMLFDAGTGQVGLAPGLSSRVLPRRTHWRLPRLGYLGDEESRFEILDNQGL
jgi:hypothetical protein